MSSKNEKIYQAVTDRIIAALEAGTVPWHKPWTSRGGHVNFIRKTPYRGINQWLLSLTSMERGYSSPYWLTYKQAQSKGGQVRGGEKGTMIVFWKPLLVDDRDNPGEKKQIWMFRSFTVFNVEQCDGIEIPVVEDANSIDPIESADRVYADYVNPPSLRHGGDRAFYRRSEDHVQMPNRDDFNTAEDYYSTQFHELVHSTMHEDRLNRPTADNWGDEVYAKEELVAEMGAGMICGVIGITLAPKHEDNEAAYIASWLKKLNSDPKLVVQAASKAQQAADYILGDDNGAGA